MRMCRPFSKKLTDKQYSGPINYQIDWPGIVVDIDYENLGLLNLILKILGNTLVVKTPHGYHLYYKTQEQFPRKLWIDLDKMADILRIDHYYDLLNHPRTKKIFQKTGLNLIVIEFKKRVMSIGSYYSPKLEKISNKRSVSQKEIDKAFRYHVYIKHKVATLTLSDLDDLENYSPEKNKKKNKKTPIPFVYSCPGRSDKQVSVSDVWIETLKSLPNSTVDNLVGAYWDEKIVQRAVEKLVAPVHGKAVLCHLHNEKKPSAAFYYTRTGQLRYFEFHNRGVLRSLSLPEFLNAYLHKFEEVSKNGDRYYALSVRTALVVCQTTLPEQLQSARVLKATAEWLKKVVEHKLTTYYANILETYAKYVAFSFGDDIFSVRFAAKLFGISKTKAWETLKMLRDAGIIRVVAQKSLGKPKKAYVYSVPFSVEEALSKALRLVYLLGLVPNDRGCRHEGATRCTCCYLDLQPLHELRRPGRVLRSTLCQSQLSRNGPILLRSQLDNHRTWKNSGASQREVVLH